MFRRLRQNAGKNIGGPGRGRGKGHSGGAKPVRKPGRDVHPVAPDFEDSSSDNEDELYLFTIDTDALNCENFAADGEVDASVAADGEIDASVAADGELCKNLLNDVSDGVQSEPPRDGSDDIPVPVCKCECKHKHKSNDTDNVKADSDVPKSNKNRARVSKPWVSFKMLSLFVLVLTLLLSAGLSVAQCVVGSSPFSVNSMDTAGVGTDLYQIHNRPPKFSAASCSVIDSETFDNYLQSAIALSDTGQTIRPYGQGTMKIRGKFTCMVSVNDKSTKETFYVVPGNSGCLLSVRASQALGLVKIASSNSVHSVTVADQLVNENPSVFHGIGAHNKCVIRLHIDETVPPVAQRHRRIPFHLRKKVETEIYRLHDLDIIEPARGATPWVSPIVAAPKPRNPNEIRICIDMRQANKAIRRERHPQPTLDDIQNRLNGASVFSKLDLRSGYHQLILDEQSRYITTFSTHIGLWRYKRLNFGISSASEVFQSVIEHVLTGITGAFNISD